MAERAEHRDPAGDVYNYRNCDFRNDNRIHDGQTRRELEVRNSFIDVNKAGDLGYTPLHAACMQGNAEMVKLLTDSGADVFALSEGDAPFNDGPAWRPR